MVFERPKKTTSLSCLALSRVEIWCHQQSKFVSGDLFGTKPFCASFRKSTRKYYEMGQGSIVDVSPITFHTIEVRLTGLKLAVSKLGPFS